MREADRRRWDAVKADRHVIEQAARQLRHEATQQHYAGLRNPEVAYGLAAILDVLSLHITTLDEGVRWEAVQACSRFHAISGPSQVQVTSPKMT